MLEPHEWRGGASPLGLSGWEVLKVEQDTLSGGGPVRTYHVIRAAAVRFPRRCPTFSCQETRFTLDGRESYPVTSKRWGGRQVAPSARDDARSQGVTVTDTPAYGGAVRWRIYRTRLVCAACRARTFESLPGYIDLASRMTARCHRYVRHQATTRPYLSVATEIGTHDLAVRDVVKESYDPEALRRRQPDRPPKGHPRAPGRYLGIDEISLFDRGNPDLAHVKANRTTFVDLESGNVLGLLSTDALPAVTGWIGELTEAERKRIRGVAVDMNLGYREAVRVALPGAVVVVDRYHVEERAQAAADKVRRDEVNGDAVRGLMKGVGGLHRDHLKMLARMLRSRQLPRSVERRNTLRDYLRSHPRTWAAFQARQEFGLIYDTATTRAEAERRFEAWRKELDPIIADAFAEVEKAFVSSGREILAYFDMRITNGATESANVGMRRVVRAGPSIHLETLRAKVRARSRLRPTRSFFCDACWERSPIDPDHHLDVTGRLVCEECRAKAEKRPPRPDKMRKARRRPRARLTIRDLFAMEADDHKPRKVSLKRRRKAGPATQIMLPLRTAVAAPPRPVNPSELQPVRRRGRAFAATQPFKPVRQGPTPLRDGKG